MPGQSRRVAVKNAFFVALIVIANTLGNLFLAISMSQMPSFHSLPFLNFAAALLANVFFLSGTALVAVSMFAQLTMYTWADLSYVLPVTASGYIVTAVLAKFFLHEDVSGLRWIGVVIIAFGVFFVAHTSPDTKHMDSHRDADRLQGAQK